MEQLVAGAILDVEIETLAFGGDGVARIDGRALFVRSSAPLDRLRVRITPHKKRLEAEIVEVLTPSPLRRDPLCEHFGTCGGCQLQHMTYAAQLEAKRAFVRDALRRIGGIAWDAPIEIRSAAEYGYRSRAEIAVDTRATPARLGFRRRHSHEVLDVGRCPVLAPATQSLFDRVRAQTPPRRATAAHLHACAESSAAEWVDERDKSLGSTGEAMVATERVAGFSWSFSPRSFAQGNSLLLPALIDAATLGAQGLLAFDLYCGAGLFALPLSRAFERVLGVENDARAVELARANALANRVGNVTFEAARVERWLANARRLAPQFIVLDPPRSGAHAEVIEELGRASGVEVRYVSCDPTTLARDLKSLVARGFTLERLAAFDLFPQTYHVEVVAVLRR